MKKKGSMFFESMIHDFGSDFMVRARPNDIFKKAHLMFKDIARGNIELEKYGQYFLDGNLLTIFINASYEKRFYYITHVNGMNLIRQFPQMCPNIAGSDMMENFYRADNEALSAYSILNDGFKQILATGDLNILPVMMNQIKPFRYAI